MTLLDQVMSEPIAVGGVLCTRRQFREALLRRGWAGQEAVERSLDGFSYPALAEPGWPAPAEIAAQLIPHGEARRSCEEWS